MGLWTFHFFDRMFPTLIFFLTSFVTLGTERPVVLHDFHISFCKSEVTSTSISGQISYFKDDLLLALKNWCGSDVQNVSAQEMDNLVIGYLKTALHASINGDRPLTLEITKRENDGGSVLVSFRFVSNVNIHSITIENSALFKEFKDQLNLMTIKTRLKEFNQIFEHSSPTVTLRFDQPL